MPDPKNENLLNLSLEATEEEREKSPILMTGFDPQEDRWELIVKYGGELSRITEQFPGTLVQELLNSYAILNISQQYVDALAALPQILYVEKPKRLFFAVARGKQVSCIASVQGGREGLTGRGVLVGIVDSGIDYTHPDFCNEDGTSRILSIWDQQSDRGTPPEGFVFGTEYGKEQIDEALAQTPAADRQAIVPAMDLSGHGTAVAGIAAGNGRAQEGLYRGVAYESPIIAVKLAVPMENSFPRTTQLMAGIDYLVRKSLALNMPMAINISFGNNYGSHSGTSLLETYIDDIAGLGRTAICIGTGNEAAEPVHTAVQFMKGRQDSPRDVLLGVAPSQTSLSVQIWKEYADEIDIEVLHPSGRSTGVLSAAAGAQRFPFGDTTLLVYYGEPSPYSINQEIFIDMIPRGSFVDSGTWVIRLTPRNILIGRVDLWLPTGGVLNRGSGFLNPEPYTTLTIPSTARKAIAVGAYDAYTDTYADFSGRGYTRFTEMIKPDIAAPGVNVMTTAVGGGYGPVTGTSFATPFVTGSAALMMEWGIVRGNDPFLYGEKIRASLQRGARRPIAEREYPNARWGYGALCLRDSLPG